MSRAIGSQSGKEIWKFHGEEITRGTALCKNRPGMLRVGTLESGRGGGERGGFYENLGFPGSSFAPFFSPAKRRPRHKRSREGTRAHALSLFLPSLQHTHSLFFSSTYAACTYTRIGGYDEDAATEILAHARLRCKLAFSGIAFVISYKVHASVLSPSHHPYPLPPSTFHRSDRANFANIFRGYTYPTGILLYSFALRSHELSSVHWGGGELPPRTGSINISFYFTLIEAYLGCKAP